MPSNSLQYTIRRLDKADDRSSFSCGNPDLDRYFHKYAGQHQFRQLIGSTYIAVADNAVILGFVTVLSGSVSPSDLSTWKTSLPDLPLPVLRLARLGVSIAAKGHGIGNALVRYAFRLALLQAEASGCVAIVVDAKSEAVGYYERLGFQRITVDEGELGDRPAPVTMFLSIGAVSEALSR